MMGVIPKEKRSIKFHVVNDKIRNIKTAQLGKLAQ